MIRLLDFNDVSHLHSQTIYHAVAYCTDPDSSGTIAVMNPREPYVSVGYHQFLEREIDVEYCRRSGTPIIRREVGGGAVYLDRDQLFFQCVFPREKAPLRIDNLFKLFLKPAVNTYRKLGLDAFHSRGHDIQVGEKKICGTGAGRIGEAMVVVGNIIFDFDYREMARVLRVPSEAYRRMAYDSMRTYLTTLRRELGDPPDKQAVRKTLINEFEAVLGQALRPGELSPDEHRTISNLDRKFTDSDWLYQNGGKRNDGVKINSDVWVRETSCDLPQGRLKAVVRTKSETIDDIRFSGDFDVAPDQTLKSLQERLVGCPLRRDVLSKTIASFFNGNGVRWPGAGCEDFLKVIIGEND